MGIVLALISACFQSAKDLFSKRIAFSAGGPASAFASFAYAMPFYAVLLAVLWLAGYETFAFTGLFVQYVILRALTDTAAETCKMSSLRCGDISLVSSFYSLAPLFLLFTSPLITGDRIPPLGNFAVVLIVLGSSLTLFEPAEGGRSGTHWKAIGLALLSALFSSLNTCFDRLSVSQASPAFSGMVMTLLAGLFLSPFVLSSPERRGELRGLTRPFLIRGGLEVAFMVLKLWALQYLPAPYVAGILRLAVIFSITGGRVLYDEPHFVRRMFGALVIILGTVLIFFAENH